MASHATSRFAYLMFGGFTVKNPVGIPQALWPRGQDPGWQPEVCGFALKIPVGTLQVCGFAVQIPAGIPQVWGFAAQIPQVCGFVLNVPVGIPQSSLVASRSRSRLGHLKVVASCSRSRLGYLKFVSSWSGSRLGYLKLCGFAGCFKLCGFVVRIPGCIPQVLWLRGRDLAWATSSLCSRSGSRVGILRGQDPGWDTSSFVASRPRSRLRYLKLVASRSRPRLAYLKFCGSAVKIPVRMPQVSGFVVRIPVGISQVLRLRTQDPGWNTSSLVVSRSRSR